MPKPMLSPQGNQDIIANLNVNRENTQGQSNITMSKMRMDRLLRKPRSKDYLAMLTRLDAGSHTIDTQKSKEITGTIQGEFPEIELSGIFLGIVQDCEISGCEVHTLENDWQLTDVSQVENAGNQTGQVMAATILHHYKVGEKLPGDLEKARNLARNGNYAFIEVYVDCCRCVSASGAVSVVS